MSGTGLGDTFVAAASGMSSLLKALKLWEHLNNEFIDEQRISLSKVGHSLPEEAVAASRRVSRSMLESARPYLHKLLEDNSEMQPEELAQIAQKLSPGGAHDGGLLIRIIVENGLFVDGLLSAATIYRNWHGGKQGFQFLPDPASTALREYQDKATSLLELINDETDYDPTRILIDEDRAFFDSLPDTFTVYRGCSGISAAQAAAGVCWTTSRRVAEWFAWRGIGDPVVLSTRARKHNVCLVKASEFEVVLSASKHRQLKFVRQSKMRRPEISWSPPDKASV